MSNFTNFLRKHEELIKRDPVNRRIVSIKTMSNGEPQFIVEESSGGILKIYIHSKVDPSDEDGVYGILMSEAHRKWSFEDDWCDNEKLKGYSRLFLAATVGSKASKSVFEFARDEKFRIEYELVSEPLSTVETPEFLKNMVDIYGRNLMNLFISSLVDSDGLLESLLEGDELPQELKNCETILIEIIKRKSEFMDYYRGTIKPISDILLQDSKQSNFTDEFIYNGKLLNIPISFEMDKEYIIFQNSIRPDFENLAKGIYIYLTSKPMKKVVIYNFFLNRRYEFVYSGMVLESEVQIQAVPIVGKFVHVGRRWCELKFSKDDEQFYIEYTNKGKTEIQTLSYKDVARIIRNNEYRD